MTSWIWMKDVSVALADPPTKPVNEHDTRMPVKDLIATHRDAIDQVKTSIEKDPHYDPDKHDDLWRLRFVLSQHPPQNNKQQLKEAIQAAKHALQFRALHKLDEADIRFKPIGRSTPDEALQRHLRYFTDDGMVFALPDAGRGVVGFFNVGGINQHGLVANIEASNWPIVFRHYNEWQFQWNDYVTRTTGLLTQAVSIADLAEFKLREVSLEACKRDGDAMDAMDVVYPQNLQKVYICNAPAWIQVPWRILRPILPKRVVDKCDFINPNKNVKEKNRLYEHVDEQHLPERLGGKYATWPATFPLPEN